MAINIYQTAGAPISATRLDTALRAAVRALDGWSPEAAARAWCADADLPGALAWQRASDHANIIAAMDDQSVVVEIECPGVDL